jgi:hypothetical protein
MTIAAMTASIAATRDRLVKVAAAGATPAAIAARRLADSLGKLEKADASALTRANAALVPGLKTLLMQLRAALAPEPIKLETLPDELKSEWLAPDGKVRIEVAVKGNANDNATLQRFASDVHAIAPNATGAPISTYESGRTVVGAFAQAGVLSLLAIVGLLFLALRNTRDVILTLGPLLAASVMTFATCVALGVKLNFANIIVLPLLFGIGVAFHIYFVIAWREGGRNFLQSSLSRAVLFSALTTATGFGTLWLSSHPGTASMGELLMISLAWTLITLFFLPALLETAKAR